MTEVLISERAADWLTEAEPEVRERIREKLRSITDFRITIEPSSTGTRKRTCCESAVSTNETESTTANRDFLPRHDLDLVAIIRLRERVVVVTGLGIAVILRLTRQQRPPELL